MIGGIYKQQVWLVHSTRKFYPLKLYCQIFFIPLPSKSNLFEEYEQKAYCAIAIISSMIWLLCMSSCTRSDVPLSSPQEQPLKDLGKDSRAIADALDLYKAMYGTALRSNSSELEVEKCYTLFA